MGAARAGLALLLAVCAAPLAAQAPDPLPPLHQQALERLAEADTAAAIALLRQLTRQQPRYGPGWLRLGAVLGDRAVEVERDHRERMEAKRALDRAIRLMGNDPEALLEYGLLLRKQQMRDDAKRALDRAWAAAERRGEELPAAQRARLHYSLGKIYETWWEDWADLIHRPDMAPAPPTCTDEEGSGFDGRCTRAWREAVGQRYTTVEHLKAREYDLMLAHFRAAHAADPSHGDAAVSLLGHLAEREEWDEFHGVATRLAERRPADPRPHLFVGLALHERGQPLAAAAFERALALLGPEDRRVFDDIELLLPQSARPRYAALEPDHRGVANAAFFTGRDPLYLTGVSERRLEHFARLAWADLRFSAPASGLRGWDTMLGQIWVRYGRPEMRWQCCAGAGTGVRAMYWSYGDAGPTFVFFRNKAYRTGLPTEGTRRLLFDLREEAPELYWPRTITAIHALPHQLVRFRGAEPGEVRVEVYGHVPVDSLGVAMGDELQSGFFVFDAAFAPLISAPRTAPSLGGSVALAYRVHLPPGTYRYGLEARAAGPDSLPRPMARERETLQVEGFPEGRLALSDILLARSLRPRADAAAERAELLIVPMAGTTLEPGEPLHLFYEIYGLAGDDAGHAAIRAELSVEDATRRNVVDRLVRGAEQLFRRGDRDTQVRWERMVPVRGDVAVDYLTVELNTREPGDYVVRVRVSDVATGQQAETVRRFRIVAAGR
jgi:GWxTD domain-containing protein